MGTPLWQKLNSVANNVRYVLVRWASPHSVWWRKPQKLARNHRKDTWYTLLPGVFCRNLTFYFISLYPIYQPPATLALAGSPSLVTQIRGHIAGPPPPSPLRYVPSSLSREDFIFSFPRRLASIVPTHAVGRSQQLIFFLAFLQGMKSKSHHGENRTQGPTLVVFEGNH